ncbi:hypothetical protein N7466_005216 [Penicillium verhagenii]|uniref:uncharacterized protein n=1 Tax=Penicillium verhagenii TaxID=1562060 RepID=UPI002545AA20|nr:uncharacterized protein N7466_005216 [Penicillium verhagenii]KAJ5935669.1 hypothetical protein N7466_005216 [Penicillium verhagenii]
MYLLSLLGAISLLIAAVAAESSDIFYWPVGSPQPSLLARVAYDPASLKSELVSYHPPSSSSNDDGLVRIGHYAVTPSNPKQWSGSLVSLSALTGEHQPTIRLHLGPSNEVYHISLAASSSPSDRASAPKIELAFNTPGTQPHLNRPIVLRPDGQNPDEVPEKTLFQKYWWVLLIVTFLTMSGGGGGGGE